MLRLAVAFVFLSALPALAEPISKPDRDALIQDLERSRAMFLSAIADVQTEAQWNYKPAPDRWSVAECAAHIIAAEDYFKGYIATALKNAPLTAEQRSTAGDAMMQAMIRDRTKRFQAPAQLEPAGKVAPKAKTIADFEATRAKTLGYVRTTSDALREHGTTTPNVTSAYQFLLLLSGHTERHTAQLLEVKASPGYPKN